MNEEDWKERFKKTLTQSYPGDSGIGGNDPQEPDWQMAAYPDDVLKFIKTEVIEKLIQDAVETVGQHYWSAYGNKANFEKALRAKWLI